MNEFDLGDFLAIVFEFFGALRLELNATTYSSSSPSN